MFIHRENALKAHQHISCILFYTCHFKKKINTKYAPRRIKLHIFKKFSRRVACPLACVQLISLFLYIKKTFFHSECNQNID